MPFTFLETNPLDTKADETFFVNIPLTGTRNFVDRARVLNKESDIFTFTTDIFPKNNVVSNMSPLCRFAVDTNMHTSRDKVKMRNA
jgi:hypothetical protein